MRVLHLEDTKALRDILQAILTSLQPDCEVVHFTHSDDALAYIRAEGHSIDLFLLDVRVPGSVDGLDVAATIKEMALRGVVVMTSAYLSPGQERLANLNAHWFQKPWHIDDVQKMLSLAKAKVSGQ